MSDAPGPWPPLRGVLAVTVPVHVLLPLLLWLVHRDAGTTARVVAGLHALGAAALLLSVRWWWGRVVELLLVLVVNHAATFVVGSWLLQAPVR